MPDDSLIPGRATEKVALNGAVLSSVKSGGAGGARTLYLFNAIEALSQLSYSPSKGRDSGPSFNIASLWTQPQASRLADKLHNPAAGAPVAGHHDV